MIDTASVNPTAIKTATPTENCPNEGENSDNAKALNNANILSVPLGQADGKYTAIHLPVPSFDPQTAREYITTKLLSTKRPGMKDLLAHMERKGFFHAPASTHYHSNFDGGLVVHSANVLHNALAIAAALMPADDYERWEETLIIAAALHDLGKMGVHSPYYVPNLTPARQQQSKAKPYRVDPALTALDHAIRSVQLASQYIRLTDQEAYAIACHDGPYGGAWYAIRQKLTWPLMIVHWADMWAGRYQEPGGMGDDYR